ncbi:MAG TPA: HYR domain-containing protein, partial [Acidobacteriota bacterium]|nr:HYR domain-containing protein [Acidobacteriota bacterium]
TAPSAGDYSFSVTNGQVLSTGLNLVTYLVNGPTCPTAGLVTILAGANRTTAHEQIACVPLTSGQTVFLIVDDNTGANEDGFFVQVTQCSKEPEFAPSALNGTNDSTGTATAFVNGITGQIGAAGDVDFYTIPNQAVGSRVFAIVNGAFSASTNFDMRITNATDTLEFDNLDNVTMFGASAPNIAGRPLTAASGQFFRVSQNAAGTASAPYQLFAVTRPMGSEVAETAAANDTIDDAGVQTGNYFSGSFSSTADVDLYKFPVTAGDLIFVSFDGSPDRTGTLATDAQLKLLDPAGNALVQTDDFTNSSSTTSGAGSLTATTPNSPAEALLFQARTSGTYYVRVNPFTGTTYLLSIATISNADVSITKTDGVTSVNQGGTLTYTITATNNGPGNATGTIITDNFPAQITTANWTASYGGGASGPASGTGNINATIGAFPSGGTATFTVTATVGSTLGLITNTATATTAVGVTDPTPGNNSATDNNTNVIATPCILTCPSNIVTNNSAGQCGAVVTFGNPTTTGSCGTVTAVPPSGSFFSVGSTMVTFTSTAGPSCSFTVTVNDTEPPVVTCPTNITVLASSSAGAVVTFTPTASDNCPGVVVTSDPASGSTFPVGTTIVTVTATDASNNTATCTFDVNVEGVERAGIYVADTQNNRCQMSNGFVWGVVPGAPGTVGSGNGQFRLPEAIVANFPGQRIYVADTGNNRIQYTTNGGGTWQNFATLGSGANQVRAPQGLAIDNLGNLYVSDTGNNRVLRFDGGVPGNAVILAAAGSTAGKVNSPRGLAIDLDFNLYVAEFQNNRIQRFANANTASPTASLVATVGSSLSPGQVRAPEGVAVDNAGNLYVADTGNNRIIMFTANAPSTLSTAATLICSSGSALGQVRAPEGVVIGAGEILGGGPTSVAIFISDTGNNRVQGSFLPTGPGSFVLVSTPNNVGSGMGQFRAPSKIR